MRRLPRFVVCTVLPLTLVTSRPAVPADAPAKLPTRTVTVKVHPDHATWYGKAEVALELVRLPPGKVVLTDADGKKTEHPVRPVWMSRYETRWDEYEVFWNGLDLSNEWVRKHDIRPARVYRPYMPPYGAGEDARFGYPADCVHFQAARRYCAWLTEYTGKRFRLPTEAEWTWACRAGGRQVRPDAKALDRLAWFADNAGNKPHPVGTKRPNAWGLHDMLGNVGEFVVRDPKDDKGLLAGGSWKDKARDVHSGAREPYSPGWQKNDPEAPPSTGWLFWSVHHVGFRVVMEE